MKKRKEYKKEMKKAFPNLTCRDNYASFNLFARWHSG